MTFLPIVDRELSVAAKLTATYRSRAYAPIAVAGIGITKVLLLAPITSPGMAGSAMFHTLSLLTVIFCLLEGVRKTADAVSQEKRDGTLGLLFLTDLKGYDVVLGKMTAAALTSCYGLLAMVPILAWSMFLGGVTLGEVWRVGIAAMMLLFFSLSVGIFVSTRSFSANRAMIGTLTFVLAACALPLVARGTFLAPLSPACAFMNAFDAMYRIHWLSFWCSMLLAPLFCWGLLAAASANIMHFREGEAAAMIDKPEKFKAPAIVAGTILPRAKLRTKLLDINPIFWLAHCGATSPLIVWSVVFLAGAGIAVWSSASGSFVGMSAMAWVGWVALAFAALMHITFKVLIATQACRCLAESRRNATLELLLCAPLKADDILQGQILALRRTFFRAALVLIVFEITGLFWAVSEHTFSLPAYRPGEALSDFVFVSGAYVVYTLVDLQAVAWAGMWFGLCSRNESRATFKTVLFVILLPYLTLMLLCIGVAMLVACPIASLVWARLKLQEHFRSLAGQRMTSSGVEPAGWVPFEVPDMSENEALTV